MPSSLNDFEVLHTIGSGSYGTCKKIRRKSDGKIFVWKEMDYGSMTETEKQMLVSEVNLLRELKHENIVRYHERIVDKKKSTLYLIMEYCEGGDLAALIKQHQREGRRFDEDLIWKTLAQCAQALNVCHKKKDGKFVLHRDLKPANIFLDAQKNVKLGDFGLARVLHETSFAKTFVGTPYYMSPEQMNKLSYNEKSDIWSLGCVLYELCTLRPPFLATNQRELAVKIRLGQFTPIPYRYSRDLSMLIDKMLGVECVTRPSIDELLRHPSVSRFIVTTSTPESSSRTPTTSMSSADAKKAIELCQREARCEVKETQLKAKESSLNEKEAKLQALEQELSRREKHIIERERKWSNQGLFARDKNIILDENKEIKDDKPLTPILCRAKKVLDSPSKHVSFQDEEKENRLNVIAVSTGLTGQGSNLYRMKEIDSNLEYNKRKELRERLERAKHRANQLRAAEIESRVRSHHILNIR